ncbi:MAG: MarR family winged helix-turn-helix transcriptional regulator [Anaerolineales bacterium]|jgi:DNA-binding MarR family transcriptional regulator
MNDPSRFTSVLRGWSEVFMRRSIRDTMRFTRSTGLSMPQISTIMRIYHQGVCGVSDIGDYLGVTNAASSQMIHRLVEQGLLERSEDPNDRRNRLITLTPKGEALMHDFIEARFNWMQELTTQLSPEDQETIIAALTHLKEAAERLTPIEMEHAKTALRSAPDSEPAHAINQ